MRVNGFLGLRSPPTGRILIVFLKTASFFFKGSFFLPLTAV